MNRINERVSRLSVVNRRSGFFEILQPEDYLERGTKVLQDMERALARRPRRDVEYPWFVHRYESPSVGKAMGSGPQAFEGDNDTEFILHDAKLRININGHHWYHYDICSNEAVAKAAREGRQPQAVAALHVSVRTGTIVIPWLSTAEDLDTPGVDNPRLFSSELIYQAWSHSCMHAGDGRNGSIALIAELQTIVLTTIANEGTLWSIRDVFAAQRLPEPLGFNEGTQTVTLEDQSSIEFKILMGTVNGKPIARMCADHAATLGGKRIVRIHAWWPYGRYAAEQGGAMAFELSATAPLPTIVRRPTMSDKIKKGAKKVFGSLNCAT